MLRKGYEYEHRLADSWYESLPLFLRLRDIGLYGTLQKKFKGKDMPDNFLKLSEELYEKNYKKRSNCEYIIHLVQNKVYKTNIYFVFIQKYVYFIKIILS